MKETPAPIDWKTIIPIQLECTRCAHQWLRRTLTRPKQCPRCKVKRWDIPSRRQKPLCRWCGRTIGQHVGPGSQCISSNTRFAPKQEVAAQ